MEKQSDNFELEDMKQQIRLLKDKLAKEAIVNDRLIRESTRDRISYITRKKRICYAMIVFALIYCNMLFIRLEYSWLFCLYTSLFLVAAGIFQWYSHQGVEMKRITTDNLLDISKALARMNRLGLRWLYFGVSFCLLWLVWFMVESYPKEGGEFICYGGSVGLAVGSVIGIMHCVAIRRKAKQAIRDIEEYTKDEA